MRTPPDLLGLSLLVVWSLAGLVGLWLFARGWRRNWARRQRLRDTPNVHPGRFVLARSRLRRDAVYFALALLALGIAAASVLAPTPVAGPAIGIGLTLMVVVIDVEGYLAQREDRLVERYNAPRDGGDGP